MLTAVVWKWGTAFGPEYVNRTRAMLERHLHLEHELVCVSDDAAGIDPRVRIVPMPTTYANTPRCRRRMEVFSKALGKKLGTRLLCLDLDVVLVDDITMIVHRPEPLVGWLVAYAGVMSGSFLLMDAGVLDGLWQKFKADPEGYPKSIQTHGTPSDQAMLNAYLKKEWGKPVPHWTEGDGFVTYFGKGYEQFEHRGVGPRRTQLPKGARVVVLGGADRPDLEGGRAPWIREHWLSIPAEATA